MVSRPRCRGFGFDLVIRLKVLILSWSSLVLVRSGAVFLDLTAAYDTVWRRGVVVSELVVSTKLPYVEPGKYWDG